MHLWCNNDDAAGRGSARQTRLVHIPGRIPPGDPLPEWNLLTPAAVSVSAYRQNELTQCEATGPMFCFPPAATVAEASPHALTFLLTHYRGIYSGAD
jgi:hypothetical protein